MKVYKMFNVRGEKCIDKKRHIDQCTTSDTGIQRTFTVWKGFADL